MRAISARPPASWSRVHAVASRSTLTEKGSAKDVPSGPALEGLLAGEPGLLHFRPFELLQGSQELSISVDLAVAPMEILDPGMVLLVEGAHRAGVRGIAEVNAAPQHAMVADRAEPVLQIGAGPELPRSGRRKTLVGHEIVEFEAGRPELVSEGLEAAAAAGGLAKRA